MEILSTEEETMNIILSQKDIGKKIEFEIKDQFSNDQHESCPITEYHLVYQENPAVDQPALDQFAVLRESTLTVEVSRVRDSWPAAILLSVSAKSAGN